LESAEFHAAFGKHSETGPGIQASNAGNKRFRKSYDKVARQLGGATRDIVYNVGKVLGFKFRPWGAVKLAKTLGKVGAVMAVVGVGCDIVDMFMEERRLKKREGNRREIERFLRESVPRVVEAVGYGEGQEPGILRSFQNTIDALKDFGEEQSRQKDRLLAEMNAVKSKLHVYEKLRKEAENLLGGNPWEIK
jgi:hypothetical protein